MENEKRKVGDYTVLCAVNIGSREIILAENEQSTNGERFLCCYGERNDIFEKFTECAVGGDYIDATLFFAERIKQDAEKFRAEVEKLDIPVTVITQADCIPDHYKNDINGKIIAINPAILKPEYQRADRQLYYVTGGFGASANSRGSAVFCKNLYDGKNTRYERMDVLGEVKPECMPDWAEKKAILFRHTQSSKLMFEYGGRMFSPYRLFTKAENTLDFISLHTARDFELGFMSKDCPESKTSYRLYDDTALERLQQILLFRELEFSLKEIQSILQSPDFDRDRALDQQICLLTLKKEHIENLITFARGLKQVGGMNMDFSAFDTAKMDEYATKAKEKWQHTNAYQEYTQKNKGRSKDAEEALARGVMLIFSDFGKCKDGDPALPEAQALVKRLQAYISENYYQCTPEILQTLGAMYGAGGEFTENIDKAGGEGTAKFVERAISIYCK